LELQVRVLPGAPNFQHPVPQALFGEPGALWLFADQARVKNHQQDDGEPYHGQEDCLELEPHVNPSALRGAFSASD
jgi:hypothetical protein